MLRVKKLAIICGAVLALNTYSLGKSQEIEIPRTAYKDIYKYYVLEEGRQATISSITLRRQSFDTIVYIKAEVNCPSRYIRQVGSSTRSAREIQNNPTQWYQPTIGTVELDIITYLCR
ncbi:hypothetical protein [Sulfurospirillum arsenophilum]|uniref:hypothetical protein n=1 Tax=Sulfurospirillum arsenophilum TaxID=56698 RepID=UPI0005A9CE75|nr:hypothetical protein [Sulfurospirillum arsenophilum]